MENKNKLALITGASKGIGFELAKLFAKDKFDLVIVSHSAQLKEAAKELRSEGVEVTEVIADLATREGVDLVYEHLEGRALDAAALNAGVGQGGRFLDTDFIDEFNEMNLNMVYLTYLTKKILKDMDQRNEGKILFTSSIAAQMPGPYYAVYAATKAFVESFAQAIRFELKDMGSKVSITALQPGPTDTDFFEEADMQNTDAARGDKDDPAKVAKMGYDALMDGKDHIIAGSFKNKIMGNAGKVMPETLNAKLQGGMAKPDSLQQ